MKTHQTETPPAIFQQRSRSAIFALITTAALTLSAATVSALEFDLIRFGKPAGATTATATDINERGEIAIRASATVNGLTRSEAHVWRKNSGFTRLAPLPGCDQASSWIINDQGVVGGNSHPTGSRARAVIWRPDGSGGYAAPVDLTSLLPSGSPWYLTGVGAISDDGIFISVMGGDNDTGYYGTVRLEMTVDFTAIVSFIPLGSFGPKPPGESDSEIRSMNNFGQVCGDAATGEFDTRGYATARAFLWDASSGMLDLLPNEIRSTAQSINDSAQMVGHFDPAGDCVLRAVYWNGVNPYLLPTLGTASISRSALYGINNAGLAVGWSDTAKVLSKQRAILWDAVDGMRLLNPLVKNSTLVLKEAKIINDNGQILAVAIISNGVTESVLLEPR